MAKLDLSKSPTLLIHELIIENNPIAADYDMVVYDVHADKSKTTARVKDISGKSFGFAEIHYTRIDLGYLFSLVEHELFLDDDKNEVAHIISEVLRKYNVAINEDDFIITYDDTTATIAAKPENPSYQGSVTFTTLVPLTKRVMEVMLNGFSLENNLDDLIKVDSLPLYEMPSDWVAGKVYTTCLTMAHDYSPITNYLDFNSDGTLKYYDKVSEFFKVEGLQPFPADLTFALADINIEMDGYHLTQQLTSIPYENDLAAGSVIIRY